MKVLIAGAHGTSGHGIASSFLARPEMRVSTVSRRGTGPAGSRHVALDLLDPVRVSEAAPALADTEVLVFAARAPGRDAGAEAEANLAMLCHLVGALDGESSALRRVCLVHGTKWYGCHLGAYRVPARESGPRGAGPLFYFDQYDWLRERRRGRAWDMVSLRPHTVWGFAEGTTNNLVTLVAAYAAIQRARGEPLHFPGPEATWRKRSQATAAQLLGQAAVWACTSGAAADRDFNITNGDTFAWASLWPRVAAHFGMECGEVGRSTFASAFVGAQEVWDALVQAHGLVHPTLSAIASPAYGDGLLACTWDDVSSMEAIRGAGWDAALDSEGTFLRLLRELQDARVVPA